MLNIKTEPNRNYPYQSVSGSMGEGLSKSIQPEELVVFKKLPTTISPDNIQIPERPENRRPTDRKFLFAFIIIVILLFPFLIYTMINGDFARFKWYDKCGNICGQKNKEYSQWSCTGQDFTDKPFLQVEGTLHSKNLENALLERKCVERCDYGYTQAFYTCYRKESSTGSSNDLFSSDYSNFNRLKRSTAIDEGDNSAGKYLNKHAWRVVLACFVSLGVAIIMLVLFKTATAAVVWSILGGVLLFGAVIVGGLWYLYINIDKLSGNNKTQNKDGILYMAIFFTIVLVVLFCVMVFMYKKVQLVIQLLKESTKAAFAMPLLIFVPIITFFAELIIIGLLIFTSVWMFTSGTLSEIMPGYLEYQGNAVMTFTIFFNLVVAFWSTQFVIGIQYMTIAGAVATWYWSKNKNNLDSPISRSANIVFRFHLGSIAFGSLIITIIAIIKALLSSLTKNKNIKACIEFCMESIEAFLKYLSKNSYILTAMHGKPFYKSGKRAAKIIFQNVVNIAALNYVGDFVLAMAQLLIIIFSLLITAGIMYGADNSFKWLVFLIVFFVSLFVAITSFSIFETTIDTIFICFCEDSLLNDGMARPYAMSRDLMEFVENSKKLYGDKK